LREGEIEPFLPSPRFGRGDGGEGTKAFMQNGDAPENLVKWLSRLGEIDWCKGNKFWLERGVTQVGATGEPIMSNTKTTVDACHKVLRENVLCNKLCSSPTVSEEHLLFCNNLR
jgi:DNA-sulfur modification-associated